MTKKEREYAMANRPPMPAEELTLSNRFFHRLTDHEVMDWRPKAERGWFGWHGNAGVNVSRCNREMRRRSRSAGFSNVYDWLTSVAATHPAKPQR